MMNFSVCSRKQGLGFEMFCRKGVKHNLKFKLLDGVIPVHVFSLRGVWFRLYSVGQTGVNPVPTASTAVVMSHPHLDLHDVALRSPVGGSAVHYSPFPGSTAWLPCYREIQVAAPSFHKLLGMG